MTNIPAWNELGLIPPIRGGDSTGADRTPYRVSILDFIERFAMSPDRIALLDGLLQYRAKLYEIGIVEGFQWLDGSFLEHVEMLKSRSPRDIDCVTFYEIPHGETEESVYEKSPLLFEQQAIKQEYHIDAYYVGFGEKLTEYLLDNITYWYSMWSHNRDFTWKGFVQVPLNCQEDSAAQELLERKKEESSHAND